MFRNPFDLIIDKTLINPYDVYKSLIETWKNSLSNEDRINGTKMLIVCEDVKLMFYRMRYLSFLLLHESEYALRINKEILNNNQSNIELIYKNENLKHEKFLDINIISKNTINNYNMRGHRYSSIIIDINDCKTLDYKQIHDVLLQLIIPTENKPFKKFILMYKNEPNY